MLARIVVSGASLVAAALLVPGIVLRKSDTPLQAILSIAVLAVIFGLVNAYIRPLLRAVSLPLNLITFGLFSFVLNTGLLLAVAWIADQIAERPLIRIGGFPPEVTTTTLTAAVLGSLVISVASTVMSLLTPDA
jgi:putative membrane protein